MADSVLRQFNMLKYIPKKPNRISTTELLQKLEADYPISRRQVQRDLDNLSIVFPLEDEDEGKSKYWSFRPDFVVDIPKMDESTALTFLMVEQYLKKLLPPSVIKSIEPYFQHATKILQNKESTYTNWQDKVAFLPRGQQLQPAKINNEILNNVYQALFEGKALSIEYGDKQDQVIHPQGLVYRGSVLYLVVTYWNYDDIKQLALHRITNATVSEEPYVKSATFDLQAYIDDGSMGYTETNAMLDLKVKFYSGSGYHLFETPLSPSQTIIKKEDHIEVTAAVPDNDELKWWLQGFGGNVEVVEPKALRKSIRQNLELAVNRYSNAD